jgi:protein-S-isoprenylcysteine O-methyltransferase Ste14
VTIETRDAAAVRFPPPLVYLFAVLAGVALQYLAPLPLPLGAGGRAALALLVGGLGAALVAAAFGLFRRTGQDPKPWTTTPAIITTGIYAWTRNPMYVGVALLQAAIAVALANGWILLLVPAALAIVYAIAVRHEERYLEEKFGDPYREYRRRVRRWL